jgi:hypothetical protein
MIDGTTYQQNLNVFDFCGFASNGGAGAHLINGSSNKFINGCDFEMNGMDAGTGEPYGLLQNGPNSHLLTVDNCHFEGNGIAASGGALIHLENAVCPRVFNTNLYGGYIADYAVNLKDCTSSILMGNEITGVQVADFNYILDGPNLGDPDPVEINNLHNSGKPIHAGTWYSLFEILWGSGGSAVIVPGVDNVRYRLAINAGVLTPTVYAA